MRAIQITIDEALLKRLDRDPDVKKEGRSAIFRLALTDWLKQRRRRSIRDAYQRGYATRHDELAGWAGSGTWPEE